MKTKYPLEKIEELAHSLGEIPALPPKFIPKEVALNKLSKVIRELHEKKNYDPREIVKLFKDKGVVIMLKDVREILKASHKKHEQKTE
jgi:hypothetical protein